jgi:hypothetical protein
MIIENVKPLEPPKNLKTLSGSSPDLGISDLAKKGVKKSDETVPLYPLLKDTRILSMHPQGRDCVGRRYTVRRVWRHYHKDVGV